jgi:integrase
MPRRPKDQTYPYRTREKMQFRSSRGGTWVGRVTTVLGPGVRNKSEWMDLGSNDESLAQRAYDRWFDTGELPVSERGRRKFRDEAERVVVAQLEAGEKKAKDRLTRLRTYAYPVLGHLEVRYIESANVSAVFKKMVSAGKSKGYCLKMRSDISQVLIELIDERVITSNVALGAKIPDRATTDTRPRMALSDEQMLEFRRKRGFKTQIDVMALLARDVGGHRGSDACAGRWQDCDLEEFAWLRVRRPKTDPETGKAVRVGGKRHYELVDHGVPEHVRPHLRAWHQKQGSPTSGPMFPLERDAKTGPVTLKDGRVVERRGGKAGEFKRNGGAFARMYRRAVWEAKIYCPLPGFDPARPDPAKCAFQTDTDETRKLGFHTLRAELATALADAGVNIHTSLAITGHTQVTTQSRHYMRKRTVKVPDAALPGGRRGTASDGRADESALEARVAKASAAAAEAAVRATLSALGLASAPTAPKSGAESESAPKLRLVSGENHERPRRDSNP